MIKKWNKNWSQKSYREHPETQISSKWSKNAFYMDFGSAGKCSALSNSSSKDLHEINFAQVHWNRVTTVATDLKSFFIWKLGLHSKYRYSFALLTNYKSKVTDYNYIWPSLACISFVNGNLVIDSSSCHLFIPVTTRVGAGCLLLLLWRWWHLQFGWFAEAIPNRFQISSHILCTTCEWASVFGVGTVCLDRFDKHL